MDPKHLPILMMIMFFMVIFIGRVVLQFVIAGDSGIRSGTKLRTKKQMLISFLLSCVFLFQAFLAWLYNVSRLEAQVQLGVISTAVGVALCIIGIAFSSYSQYAMGKDWRIGVDPDEKTRLVTTGIYKKIRNPIYTGCIIYGAGLIILAPHILFLITGIVGYFAIRMYVKDIEEPYLVELHGDDYRDYVNQTGAFFPRVKAK